MDAGFLLAMLALGAAASVLCAGMCGGIVTDGIRRGLFCF